ncbi:hypothetical protein GCM10023186_13260 [Hymenobacter koreensis]|uniref:Transporter n=2 Tax=Hymenobacter koreensis TaxID=1084523 RepID=A0ABP8IWX9_9BACT
MAQSNSSVPVDSARYTLFKPTPRDQLRKLHPDRPGITQSAYTINPGHFQLETNLMRLRKGREDGGPRHRELLLNHAVLKMGVTERMDVQVKVESYSVEKEWPDDAAGPERHTGFGDVSVRVKRNLFGDDSGNWALAVSGYVTLPTGAAVGRGGLEGGLSIPVEYKIGEGTGLSMQVQGDIENDRETNSHYFALQPAATINHDFTKFLGSYAEVMSHWNAHTGRWRHLLNLGPEFTLSENVQFDMGAGIPLNAQTDREFFIGFTYRR